MSSSSETTPFTLELPPDLIVHEPEELRRDLLAALATGRDIVLDARETHRVGIVGLQLILGLLREAQQKGVGARFAGMRSELVEALRCTGLDQHPDVLRARL